MQNMIVCKKGVVSILAILLLAFSIQFISYSQVSFQPVIKVKRKGTLVEIHPPRELNVEEIDEKVIRSVVWIMTDNGQGSGVLIDEKLKFVITNQHITQGAESVEVFFPIKNGSGDLIRKRDFYTDDTNREVLYALGYRGAGRVLAEDPDTDLAIIKLKMLPDTARQIEYDFGHYGMEKYSKVHIIGNPGNLELWRWNPGYFEETQHGGILLIKADTYPGNSGSPVVDGQGKLIGIVTRSDTRLNTWAVPTKSIKNLLNRLTPVNVFSITNNTTATLHYDVRWEKDEDWRQQSIESGTSILHGDDRESPTPQIRFDYIANNGRFDKQVKTLEFHTKLFGDDVRERIRLYDVRKYHFEYNASNQRLALSEEE